MSEKSGGERHRERVNTNRCGINVLCNVQKSGGERHREREQGYCVFLCMYCVMCISDWLNFLHFPRYKIKIELILG